ncbi:PaaI family thioesterase [Mycobacterium shimoidei]|uniref:PaaI family thioesterase n=1 Tax=Mycobacterium shimoidei TaxID=29313 RepID=UPI0008484D51|nr:acyl-CoA thioesterase domain-containing protein [Mycobacterium shimoidei]MCV7260416.1 thioesterase family protein [Mycobacterium shimoidei]ODR11303.1 hypothetical protein BHQ16_18570 [Mycobacterium shimoidei]ORW78147.1 hypothetical protein AWC26_18180 [Mycobacterium shimoidei]
MTGAVASVDDVLGCRTDGEGLSFELGRNMHGAFGGAFGGAVAACALRTARREAPGRTPASLDVRFLRGLPAGTAHAAATVLHAGRSLTTVSVDIADSTGRAAARATVGLADPAALHPSDTPSAEKAGLTGYSGGSDWTTPDGVEIPIVATLRPRVLGAGPSWVATGLRAPWDVAAGAEAACLAADMCVGPPVAAACAGKWIPHPNPDLSLRFVGEVAEPDLVGVGRLQRISGGLAAVGITVWSGDDVVAVGVCSSMLLARR